MLSERQRNIVVELTLAGLTAPYIADKCDCSISTIWRGVIGNLIILDENVNAENCRKQSMSASILQCSAMAIPVPGPYYNWTNLGFYGQGYR